MPGKLVTKKRAFFAQEVAEARLNIDFGLGKPCRGGKARRAWRLAQPLSTLTPRQITAIPRLFQQALVALQLEHCPSYHGKLAVMLALTLVSCLCEIRAEDTAATPPEVVQLVTQGIVWRPMTIERVWPILLTDDQRKLQKMIRGGEENSISQYVRFVTNTTKVMSHSAEPFLIEEVIPVANAEGETRNFRLGRTARFAWRHSMADPFPIVLPFDEPRLQQNERARNLLQTVLESRDGILYVLNRFGLPGLVGTELHYDPSNKKFIAKKGTNEVEVAALWQHPVLHLKYSSKVGLQIVHYHALLTFRKMESGEFKELISVEIYTPPEGEGDNIRSYPLLSGYRFKYDDNIAVPTGQAANPMQLFGWKEWVEFHQDRWIRRTMDGNIMEFPGFGEIRSRSNFFGSYWLILIISTGAVCLLLARGIWRKMAKPRPKTRS